MNTLNAFIGTTLNEVNSKENLFLESQQQENLYSKLCNKEASIALVGLGYVGLPIALEFANDFNVIGFDINQSRVDLMNNNIDPSGEVSEEAFYNKNIVFSDNADCLTEAEMIIVAVPTPIDNQKNPDLTPITKACTTIGKTLKKGNYVVFESTVYPGCTEEVCIPILEKFSGLKYNVDFKVGYSPERINPGDKIHTLTTIPKIVSGSDKESSEVIYNIYNHIIKAGVHLAPSMKVAEAAKIVENTQRDVNIGLVNELSGLFERLNINTHDVLKAAGTKWNFLNFYPGLVGGHCIGVDPYYLIHKAKCVGKELPIISSTRYINDKMPSDVVSLIETHLEKAGKKIENSKILILGTTFKENVSDLRNSKPAEMAQIFKSKVKELHIVDPLASAEEMRSYYGLNLSTVIEENYDAVIYAVNHDEFDTINWEFIENISAESAIVLDFKKLLNVPSYMKKNLKYTTL
ncbi:MAG: nucleotide sugar dehydrogenase [Saprospiraceae bacterium]|nr:nucleotide sugar dehydrogenase [Saprospiraceae bacterium]